MKHKHRKEKKRDTKIIETQQKDNENYKNIVERNQRPKQIERHPMLLVDETQHCQDGKTPQTDLQSKTPQL